MQRRPFLGVSQDGPGDIERHCTLRGVTLICTAFLEGATREGSAMEMDRHFMAPTVRIDFKGEERASGRLALTLDWADRLRTTAWLKGLKISAMIDTGAGRTVLDKAIAAKLGIATRSGFNVAGITANAHGELADNVSIVIGDLTLSGVTLGVLDLGGLSAHPDEPIGLILGRELFANTLGDFDFAKNEIEFFDPQTHLGPSTAMPVSLQQSARGTPHIPLTIGLGPSIQAGFDVGYSATVLLSPAYVDATGLLRGKRISTVASRGIEGLSVSRVATLESITLGNATLSNVPVEIPSSWNRPMPAVVGLEIIKRFHVVTDYSHDRVWLSPYPGVIDTPLSKDRSGIGAVPYPGGFLILHVAKGSPAEHAGLRRGDRIVAIDDEAIDDDYAARHPRMGMRPPGTVSMLSLSDERKLRLELADYY